MSSYRILSSDDHVIEPADLWTSRVEPKFRDRVPHIERREDGNWWYCDGQRVLFAAGSQAGKRFEDPHALKITDDVGNVRAGGYIPDEHVKDMDLDGVDVSVLYPTVGLLAYNVPDSELLTAVCRTYNDWIAEYCEPFPDRLKGIGMINIDNVSSGLEEMKRCAKMGLVGAMITVYPPEDRSYGSKEYEPLWAAAQDLGMPLSLHVATNRATPGQETEGLQVTEPHCLRQHVRPLGTAIPRQLDLQRRIRALPRAASGIGGGGVGLGTPLSQPHGLLLHPKAAGLRALPLQRGHDPQ